MNDNNIRSSFMRETFDACDALANAKSYLNKAQQAGMKHDEGKQRYHAMPLVLLEPLADLFEAGARIYERFNCLQPFDNPDHRFYNAMMRHVEASQIDPLARDPETDCYHLAAVAFSALMRLYHCRIQGGTNEVPKV